MTRSRRRKLMRTRAITVSQAMLKGVPLGAAALFAALPQAQAQNQDTEPVDNGGLQEVVVSAQKRTENLQNVPLSVQALGTEKIEELHLQNFADYASFLPTLSYQSGGQAGGPGFSRAFMRGIASGDTGNHSGSSPSVGTYLDEQPITTISGALDVHLYDIARVEALAGPQGTLYGASSQAGTIRIITNKPDPSGFEGGYDLEANSVAHGDQGYVAEGFANIPISANAAVRLVGWYQDNPGFIDNVPGSVTYPTSGITRSNELRVKDNYNTGKTYGGRAALKVDLNDTWTITPSVMAQHSDVNGSFGYHVGTPFQIVRYNPENSKDKWWQAALTVEGKFSNFDVVYAGGYVKRDDVTHLDYVDYAFYYDQYAGYGSYVFDNAGELIDPTQHITGKDGYRLMSHELRISTPVDKRFRAVAGVFYNKNRHNILQDYLIDGLADSLSVTGWPETWWLTDQVRIDRDSAVFGELSFDITDKLTLTGGIRFFKSDNTLEGFYGYSLLNDFTSRTGEKNPECAANPDDFRGAPCKNLDKRVKESGNTPKINLTYHFNDEALGYLTYSEGFRPGGVNRTGNLPPYKADFLKNYEAGWKTTWLDNRVRFNGAVFVEKWQNFQFSFLGPSSVTQIANAGNARLKGVETELVWAATRSLTISAGAAYVDSKLLNDYCGLVTADGVVVDPCPIGEELAHGAITPAAPKGARLPVTPKFKGNVVARYEFGLGQWDAHVQGAAAYIGNRLPDMRTAQLAVLGKEPAYTIANFAFGIDRKPYSIELFMNNAFDKKGQADRWAQCDALVCGVSGTYITPTQPRAIGIKFGQRF